jgi:hypothetical protein
MNKITWLELYNFLYEKANNVKNFGDFNWNSPVIIHDASTGDEYSCDTYIISDKTNQEKLVLLTNIDSLFSDIKDFN